MGANRRRMSDPPPSSLYPASPAARGSRSSSIFPYSLARPPTNYSQHSWVNPDIPPIPSTNGQRYSRPQPGIPIGGNEEENEEQLEGETPLYARSDWDESSRSPVGTDDSAYSRSSFAGLTTAPPTTAWRANTLGDIREEEEYTAESAEGEGRVVNGGWGYGEDRLMMSPGAMTATPRTNVSGQAQSQTHGQWVDNGLTMSPGAMTATPQTAMYGANGLTMSLGAITPKTQGRYESVRRSTLPSVLELGHLTGHKQDPFADPSGTTHRRGYGQQTPVHTVSHSPGAGLSPRAINSPRLLSPGEQQKLGRMSVATARYLDNTSSRAKKAPPFDPYEMSDDVAALPKREATGLMRFYSTWRPFIVAALSLVSALLLTISLQNNPGPVSRYIIVPSGGFSKSPSNVGDIGLGVNGWCPLSGEDCQAYTRGDFADTNGTYTLPGDPLLDVLGDLLTALCALSWLSALYALTAAFLHFFLFFALSLPFTHLLDEAVLLAPNGGPGKDAAQAEVDIRVRTERPPYEAYHWVWWGWYGHKRAPVGHVYSVFVTVLALSSFIVGFLFKKSVADATGNDSVRLGAGAFIPVLAFVLALDPLISALKWGWHIGDNWSTFLHPPSPSPAAIMLPPEMKPMAHIRNASGASFFAPRATIGDTRTNQSIPPVPGAELDEETRRWLIAYPADEELVSLIADLRTGGENDDFILSDQGLLYVRPGDDEPALLVPPKGEIRAEILEDAHHEPDENGNSAHGDKREMMEILGETFWWMSMEEDVEAYIERCAGCAYDRGGVAGIAGLKAGMTPVPFTGVTGWTAGMTEGGGPGDSAMAAEMAFAMRKAEEEANKDALR